MLIMYLFIVSILFINIFLMCKVIVFIFEFLLINFFNKLYQTKYRLELHKNRIPNDENGWNFEIIEQEDDIKLNDFTFIDDKLD